MRKAIEESGVVFFTVCDTFVLTEPSILEMIHQYEKTDRRIIRFSLDGLPICHDFIMLDDREVGRMAAEMFHRAGTKKS